MRMLATSSMATSRHRRSGKVCHAVHPRLQWNRGYALCVDPVAPSGGQVSHGVLREDPFGDRSGPSCGLCHLVHERTSSAARAATGIQLVTWWYKTAGTGAGAAIFVLLKCIFGFRGCPCCLCRRRSSGCCEWVCQVHFNHDRMAGQHREQVTPLGTHVHKYDRPCAPAGEPAMRVVCQLQAPPHTCTCTQVMEGTPVLS